jgi:acyl-homoserine-lactone acylase
MLTPDRFDATMRVDSAPAAVLGAFVHVFTRETFADELGPEDGLLWHAFVDVSASGYSALQDHLHQREKSPFWDNVGTPKKETKADILALSLARAIQLCRKRMGGDRDKWQWGLLHTYTWRHDITRQVPLLFDGLNRGPFPAGGDSSTPNVSGYYWGKDLDVFLIPILRMIVDFGSEEPLHMLTVPGQSGNPHSPHYADMIPLFLKGELHPMPFGAEAVRKQYSKVLVLSPK